MKSFVSQIVIILVNGVTDHIISTQKTIIKNFISDIYFHVAYHFFRYFTAFVNLGPLVNQFQIPKQFVHMSKGMFSQK